VLPAETRGDLDLFSFRAAGKSFVVLSFDAPGPREDAVLTPAEREVATLVLDGLTSQAIAARRGTAVRTVANQLASIYQKLGIGSRAELAALESWLRRDAGARP
jgi:DNA-binding CsgD family transcriptional regulator